MLLAAAQLRRQASKMSVAYPATCSLLLSILVSSCALHAPSSRPEVVAHVELKGPTVVAFLPVSEPGTAGLTEVSASELMASALERAKACLGKGYASYLLVTADRIVVHSSEGDESFEISTATPLTGALLLRPKANPRIIFAGGGPEALRRMLRRAASDYFVRACDA
jgi:hypothetical protein